MPGANGEYLRLINAIRGGYNDGPATELCMVRGWCWRMAASESTYLQNVTISQADTIISTTSGGFTALPSSLFQSPVNATGGYDPITIISRLWKALGRLVRLAVGHSP
ncbi:MAG: hypothetical protein U0Y68_20645 [Blastocatellia bacterium]